MKRGELAFSERKKRHEDLCDVSREAKRSAKTMCSRGLRKRTKRTQKKLRLTLGEKGRWSTKTGTAEGEKKTRLAASRERTTTTRRWPLREEAWGLKGATGGKAFRFLAFCQGGRDREITWRGPSKSEKNPLVRNFGSGYTPYQEITSILGGERSLSLAGSHGH